MNRSLSFREATMVSVSLLCVYASHLDLARHIGQACVENIKCYELDGCMMTKVSPSLMDGLSDCHLQVSRT